VAGDYAAAVDALYEAERRAAAEPLYARLPEVRSYLADALLRLQRVDEAAAVAERLTAAAPDYPTGWFLLGKIRMRTAVTQVALAARAFEQTRTTALRYTGPIGFDHALGDWKADLGLADVARLEGRWRDAIRLYRDVAGRVTEAPVRAMLERQWKRLVDEARAVTAGFARPS
jgi:tetratricopeptide (TPR) repeat protein